MGREAEAAAARLQLGGSWTAGRTGVGKKGRGVEGGERVSEEGGEEWERGGQGRREEDRYLVGQVR